MALLAGLLTGLAVQAQAVDAPVAGAAVAGAPVAGLQPDRRPAAAPRLAAVVADAALKQRRLAGISQPWPGNVERIAEQGAWFSPMFAPGMTGRYDLRGLHPPSAAGRP
jgi:hypothetical protein